MEKVTPTFWDKLGNLLLYDDVLRWKAIRWTVLTSVIGGSADVVLFNSSIEDATFLSGFLLLILCIGWVAWYCSFRVEEPKETLLFSWRSFFLGLGILLVISAFALFVTRDLKKSTVSEIQRAATDPFQTENIQQIQDTLERAQSTNLKIQPELIQNVGTKFVQTATTNNQAWNAAIALVNYRTFLNGPIPSLDLYYKFDSPMVRSLEPTFIRVNSVKGQPAPRFTTSYTRAPIAQAGLLELMGEPILQTAKDGPKSYLGMGGTLFLDKMRMKNVVLVDIRVYYTGGPVDLDNVTFINCQFVVPNIGIGRGLVNQILTSANVDFSSLKS